MKGSFLYSLLTCGKSAKSTGIILDETGNCGGIFWPPGDGYKNYNAIQLKCNVTGEYKSSSIKCCLDL